jgi:cytochrome c oxidase subunit 1
MATVGRAVGVAPRPGFIEYLWSWVTTVDHKRIGILYGLTTTAFLLVGGLEALLIRIQLAHPESRFLDPNTYNQIFTMHGLTMIFLVVMGYNATFFNLVVPLQLGARDVAFPRLNAFSYWVFLFGALLLNLGWLWGQAPGVGWFGYANLTSVQYTPDLGTDFYVMGLQVLGISSIASALNFLVTIINLRAPGMSMFKMPVFSWMTLVVSVLVITAFPPFTVGLIEAMFDRLFGTNFFNPDAGANPLLWQHLFWIFGHPEVYILVLPAMGIVSEVIPVFARKPLFGYPFVVFSGIFIGFLGWGVWAHHMFAVGLGPIANTVFGITTMLIAVPTGVKIFNWLATLWGGQIRVKTPLLFAALGFIAPFIIGGVTGVMHATVPSNYQQTDTYFVVAHFHYVIMPIVAAFFAGLYYWWPKYTGRLLDEGLGKLHFWLFFIGTNLTFGSQVVLGFLGMPRRNYTYPAGLGWEPWNLLSSIGAFVIALSVLVFIVNALKSLRSGQPAGPDPWDGRTLEWLTPSPVPVYNFAEIPVVRYRDELWARKYGAHGEQATAGARHNPDPNLGREEVHVHLPRPSYYPALAALGIALGFFGAVMLRPAEVGGLGPQGWALVGLGALITVAGLYGWTFEPAD